MPDIKRAPETCTMTWMPASASRERHVTYAVIKTKSRILVNIALVPTKLKSKLCTTMMDMMLSVTKLHLRLSLRYKRISRSPKPRLFRNPITRLLKSLRRRSKIKMISLKFCWILSESLNKPLRSFKKKSMSLKRLSQSWRRKSSAR